MTLYEAVKGKTGKPEAYVPRYPEKKKGRTEMLQPYMKLWREEQESQMPLWREEQES